MTFIRKFLNMLKIDDSKPISEVSLSNIQSELEKVKELAATANKTRDIDEFCNIVSQMENILTELSKYEHMVDFSYPPSQKLKDIQNDRDRQIALLRERLSVKEKITVQTPNTTDKPQKEDISLNGFINHEVSTVESDGPESSCNDCINESVLNGTEKDNQPYVSNRLIIKGLHLYFIDIAREIVSQKSINTIPLMREYHISENELKQIVSQIQEAKIIDAYGNVTMSIEEFEKFIDIYEPSIFECTHTVFDKDIFMVIGEIIFDKGVEDTYNSLPADEVIDYLNILENLKIISYDSSENKYNILSSIEEFEKICSCIPNSFSNTNYNDLGVDYSGADFDALSGVEFEKFCAHLLLQNGFTEIKLTPASGDHGIDILAIKNEITYAIQCKCYSGNVGNAAVQQAHTGKNLYHKDIAVVMTNRCFTPQAIEEAEVLSVKLWGRDKICEMFDKLKCNT